MASMPRIRCEQRGGEEEVGVQEENVMGRVGDEEEIETEERNVI
jgi:hypothetical protein